MTMVKVVDRKENMKRWVQPKLQQKGDVKALQLPD